jgi:predicted transcriptional regulator of viral defense system
METSAIKKVLDLIEKQGVVRPLELEASGIHRKYLSRLHRRGLVKKIGRGLYTLEEPHSHAHFSLAEVSKRIPHAVICLISALEIHQLTTQIAHQVWIAIPNKARQPRIDYPPLRVVRFSGESLHAGVGEHLIAGVRVKIFNPAKTVADCFKFRNKIGFDVALEALRDCWRQQHCTMDQLWHYAKICRVANVMRPYLESLK